MDKGLILKRPIISEKSLKAAGFGEYTFEVGKKAGKREIAEAIKMVFGVDALRVKTLIVKGRTKRSLKQRRPIKLGDWKKAIIKLKEGQKIDIFETSQKAEGAK